jgi:hypothetical protein
LIPSLSDSTFYARLSYSVVVMTGSSLILKTTLVTAYSSCMCVSLLDRARSGIRYSLRVRLYFFADLLSGRNSGRGRDDLDLDVVRSRDLYV